MREAQNKIQNFQQAEETIRRVLKTYQPRKLSVNGSQQASVLIPLLNRESVPYLIFTRRTELVEHHKGQISFPGGMHDRADTSLLQTALRETDEEIGVHPEEIQVIGQLDDLYTVTNFLITPFVGILKPSPSFRLSTDEVAEVLEVPLSLFLTNEHFEIKKWEYRGKFYEVYFYHFHDHVIWGATGFIVNRFIHVVFGYNPAPNPVYRDPRNEAYLQENITRRSG